MPQTIPLFANYYLEAATDLTDFQTFFNENSATVFANGSAFLISQALSETENMHVNRLGENLQQVYRLCYFLKKGEERIGWFKGEQKDKESFSMSNTGIFEAYRGKGIYKTMLPKILEILQKTGFQRVTSYHHPTNNAVLIPKLKAGFVISGFEITEEYGLLVKLTYSFNPIRREAIAYRTGLTKMTAGLAPYFA